MAWNDIPQGADLNTAYQAFQQAYNTTLPNHKQSLWNLASRAMKG